jgi:transposase
MRKLKEIARLRFEAKRSYNEIAAAAGVARSTVQLAVARMQANGLAWPWPESEDEASVEARLYGRAFTGDAWRATKAGAAPLPDFAAMRAELARKGVTRRLLWREYREREPQGLEYSQFCELYRRWSKTQDVVMRFEHAPGDKLFVDYAGQTIGITDRQTGVVSPAQVFVAALGHSAYTYAEAVATQQVGDWIASHVRTFEQLGGVPQAIVLDNLKAGVTRAHRYEPDVNPSYQDFAAHYGVAVLPARVMSPRDKATVESAVLVVERWVLAPLRDQVFFSIAEANAAIAPLLANLNRAPFQKREASRETIFCEHERATLRALPERPYQYGRWSKAKVHLDYHLEHERRYYSVPYALVGKTVDVRASDVAIEVYYRGERVAAHLRGLRKGQFTTDAAHRPEGHRRAIELNHERLLREAEAIGEATASVIRAQAHRRVHRDQTLRSSLGIVRLARDHGAARLEAACAQAVALQSFSYRSIVNLLASPPRAIAPAADPPIEHANVRGARYFVEEDDHAEPTSVQPEGSPC